MVGSSGGDAAGRTDNGYLSRIISATLTTAKEVLRPSISPESIPPSIHGTNTNPNLKIFSATSRLGKMESSMNVNTFSTSGLGNAETSDNKDFNTLMTSNKARQFAPSSEHYQRSASSRILPRANHQGQNRTHGSLHGDDNKSEHSDLGSLTPSDNGSTNTAPIHVDARLSTDNQQNRSDMQRHHASVLSNVMANETKIEVLSTTFQKKPVVEPASIEIRPKVHADPHNQEKEPPPQQDSQKVALHHSQEYDKVIPLYSTILPGSKVYSASVPHLQPDPNTLPRISPSDPILSQHSQYNAVKRGETSVTVNIGLIEVKATNSSLNSRSNISAATSQHVYTPPLSLSDYLRYRAAEGGERSK